MSRARHDGRARRGFIKGLTLAAAASALPAGARAVSHRHGVVRLRMRDAEHDLRAADLPVGETFLFNYPYVSTPCFLVRLGRRVPVSGVLATRAGASYRAPGGVGPDQSVVAFSAICAHRMSHPARQVSFINYRHRPARFFDARSKVTERDRVIYCCSEKSVYDPVDGARVLGGPAPQPLTAIELAEVDGVLAAVGTRGEELFEAFFERFGNRLALEYRTDDVRAPVAGMATVQALTQFSARQVLCGATRPNRTV